MLPDICSAALCHLSAAGCGKCCRLRGGDTHGPMSESSGPSAAVWGVISAVMKTMEKHDSH